MALTSDWPEGEASSFEATFEKRIPTAVADFDAIIGGGLPSGSVVLLLGDVGAGQHEYVYTSASKIAVVARNPASRRYYLGTAADIATLPERLCYVTFSRPREAILQEVGRSFDPQLYRHFRDRTEFHDLSSLYFRHSSVPAAWTHEPSLFDAPPSDDGEDLLGALVEYLDRNAANALVVVDSLTDLAVREAVPIRDLVTTVKGLQRAAKDWDGLVYLLLTRGILDKRYEEMLMDSVDGVLSFEWRNYLKSSKRQRYLFIEKFAGLVPHLGYEKTARFPLMLSAHEGLTVVYMERIS